MNSNIAVKFFHGLGDVSNFARMIPVYKNHGINLQVEATEDKKFVFQSAGAELIENASEVHRWPVQGQQVNTSNGASHSWTGNKSGENLRHYGLNVDGKSPSMDELWEEYKKVDIQCKSLIPQYDWDIVSHAIDNWQKPIILWHSIGNTNTERKSFNINQQREFLYQLIDKTDGTIVLLDWDSRVQWTLNHRIKHLQVEFGNIALPRLATLMYLANLMIGIDSGPYYFSTLTNIPSMVVYFDGCHPCEYMVPHPRTLSFSTGGKSVRLDRSKRFEYQLLDYDSMSKISDCASLMLKPHRYLLKNNTIASDVQLQQIIKEKCRGNGGQGSLSWIYDRHRSFDVLLHECQKRFTNPVIGPNFVETGCIRSDEDWGGAGFSTALFGRYCQLRRGTLTSFDLDQNNVSYAQNWCKQFGNSVQIKCCTGEQGIKEYTKKIDVLYLDSLDTGAEGHQQCNLGEFKAAESKLHEKSIVVIDDTPNDNTGKGVLTVKYMLENGWKFLYRGYQVILSKTL